MADGKKKKSSSKKPSNGTDDEAAQRMEQLEVNEPTEDATTTTTTTPTNTTIAVNETQHQPTLQRPPGFENIDENQRQTQQHYNMTMTQVQDVKAEIIRKDHENAKLRIEMDKTTTLLTMTQGSLTETMEAAQLLATENNDLRAEVEAANERERVRAEPMVDKAVGPDRELDKSTIWTQWRPLGGGVAEGVEERWVKDARGVAVQCEMGSSSTLRAAERARNEPFRSGTNIDIGDNWQGKGVTKVYWDDLPRKDKVKWRNRRKNVGNEMEEDIRREIARASRIEKEVIGPLEPTAAMGPPPTPAGRPLINNRRGRTASADSGLGETPVTQPAKRGRGNNRPTPTRREEEEWWRRQRINNASNNNNNNFNNNFGGPRFVTQNLFGADRGQRFQQQNFRFPQQHQQSFQQQRQQFQQTFRPQQHFRPQHFQPTFQQRQQMRHPATNPGNNGPQPSTSTGRVRGHGPPTQQAPEAPRRSSVEREEERRKKYEESAGDSKNKPIGQVRQEVFENTRAANEFARKKREKEKEEREKEQEREEGKGKGRTEEKRKGRREEWKKEREQREARIARDYPDSLVVDPNFKVFTWREQMCEEEKKEEKSDSGQPKGRNEENRDRRKREPTEERWEREAAETAARRKEKDSRTEETRKRHDRERKESRREREATEARRKEEDRETAQRRRKYDEEKRKERQEVREKKTREEKEKVKGAEGANDRQQAAKTGKRGAIQGMKITCYKTEEERETDSGNDDDNDERDEDEEMTSTTMDEDDRAVVRRKK